MDYKRHHEMLQMLPFMFLDTEVLKTYMPLLAVPYRKSSLTKHNVCVEERERCTVLFASILVHLHRYLKVTGRNCLLDRADEGATKII